jgi:hypothetical protein
LAHVPMPISIDLSEIPQPEYVSAIPIGTSTSWACLDTSTFCRQ